MKTLPIARYSHRTSTGEVVTVALTLRKTRIGWGVAEYDEPRRRVGRTVNPLRALTIERALVLLNETAERWGEIYAAAGRGIDSTEKAGAGA